MQNTNTLLPGGHILPSGAHDDTVELEAISGFACIIDYEDGGPRAIACRRFEAIGPNHYVGAICSEAGGYRQFRCDRINSVSDIATGESMGNGAFFHRFHIERSREVADTWGLPRSRRDHLLAGLNVLAFMAHCDGRWHPLEEEATEQFVCALWMRKEWDGEPPLDRILEHARRLAPDAAVFGAALRNFVRSTTSESLLRRYIARVIAADGTITAEEHKWAVHFDELIIQFAAEERAKLVYPEI